MRPSVRLAALSEAHVIYSWTHDSVGLGEDGPTHQPVEQLASLRAMPGPARHPPRRRQRDRPRLAHRRGLRRAHRPGAVAPVDPGPRGHRRGRRGRGPGRLRARRPGRRDARDRAHRHRAPRCRCASRRPACWPAPADGDAGRPSGPGWCRCRRGSCSPLQPESYRHEVLPPGTSRLAVEAAASFGWERYADDVVAIDHFGASAPGDEVLEHFGYTPDNVAARARALLARAGPAPAR